MTLAELLADSGGAGIADARLVAGLSSDSRAIKTGDVFFALAGAHADGAAFMQDAAAQAALAIVSSAIRPAALPASVTYVQVEDARRALSLAAARFFPAQPATIVAITGTSGKTSVAAFVRQIWSRLGHQAASIGTIGVVAPSGAVYGSLTTPDPIELHRTLDALARQGVTHVALEASSHGLDQRRLDGVRLSAGAFTNLSRDHLDYHADLDAYLAAKLRLFNTLLHAEQTAVVDADSSVAERVVTACGARGLKVLTTGEKGETLTLVSAHREGFATRLCVSANGSRHDLLLPLAGSFQAANALVAAGLCIATGAAPAAVLAALEHLQGAPGRLERVGTRNGAPILVDYAHKPDALDKALEALRPFTPGRLIVVFGCGGNRDAGKRPLMGAIAARRADVVIVTDDNPRDEAPATIRAAILAAAPNALEIADRRAAIAAGIAMLGKGDLLLVAGKGHEHGQIVGRETLPFSDAGVVAEALADLAA